MDSILQDAITEGDQDLITRLYKIKPKQVFEALVAKLEQILGVYQENNQGQIRAMVQIMNWMNMCLFQTSAEMKSSNLSGSQLLGNSLMIGSSIGSLASLSSMGTSMGQTMSVIMPDVVAIDNNNAIVMFNCARKILHHSEEVMRTLFYLSMSNPQIVLDHILRISKEDPELSILQYCAFPLDKLIIVIRHIFNSFPQLKKPSQQNACNLTRKLIWNFIEWYPVDFVNLASGQKRLDDVIDLFFSLLNEEKKKYVPLQTMLMVLNSNKLSSPLYTQFVELLKKYKKEFSSSLVDILKAAVFLKDKSDLRTLALDFEPDVREIVQIGLKTKDPQEESVLMDGLVGLYRISPPSTVKVFATMFADNKRLLAKVFYALASSDHQPWNSPISENATMCTFVKMLLHESLVAEDGDVSKKMFDNKKKKEDPRKDVVYYTIKILEMEPKIAVVDDFDTIVRDIVQVLEEAPASTRSVTLSVLTKAYEQNLVSIWAKNSSLFVKAFSFILLSISKLIFEAKKEEIMVLLNFLNTFIDNVVQVMFQDASIMLSPTDAKLKQSAIHSMESCLLYCIALTEIDLFCGVKNVWSILLSASDKLDKDEFDLLNIPHIAIYKKLLEPISYQNMFKALTTSLRKPSLSTIVCFDQLYRKWKTLNMTRQQELMDSRLKRMSTKHSHVNQSTIYSGKSEMEKETKSDWVSVTLSMCYLLPLCIPSESLEKQIYDSSTFLRFDTFFNTAATERVSIHLLVDAFISDLINLLRSENPILKEYLPHIIGEELDFSFWGLIEKKLTSQLNNNTQKDSEYLGRVITIMHKVISKNESASKTMSMAMDKMLQFLSLDIDATKDAYTVEAKLAYCRLVYTLFEKKADVFKDLVIRNFLAQIISSWISDMEYNTEQSLICKELDVTSIKCLKFLFEGLSLKPQNNDNLSKTDLKEIKERTFNNYVNVLQKVLYKTHVIQSGASASNSIYTGKEIHYLTDDLIHSFASLVANNQDIGFKFIINMAQNSSSKLRPFVLNILCFSLTKKHLVRNESMEVVKSYDLLKKFLFEHDPIICVALYENVDVSIKDLMLEKIFLIFEEGKDSLKLLKTSIERDINKTDAANVIFRRNSMSTKLLTLLNQKYGMGYLKQVIQPIINKISEDIKNNVQYEVDPLKLGIKDSLQGNTQHLKNILEFVMTKIYASLEMVPNMLRNTCWIISNIVANKFPEAKLNAVSGYFFLRFICPAIVSPENSGLTLPYGRTLEVSRALVLIAKCIQNLANFVYFGNKEEFMISLNVVLEQQIPKTSDFLNNICIKENPVYASGDLITENDLQDIYQHVFQQKIPIFNQLTLKSSRFGQQQDHDSTLSSFKKIKDLFDQLLLDLGPPQFRKAVAVVDNKYMNDLKLKYDAVDLQKIKNMGFLTEGSRTKERTPGLCFIARRFELQNIQLDHALYYLVTLLNGMSNDKYYVLIDLTGCQTESFLDAQLLDKLYLLMTPAIINNIKNLYVLNPNNFIRMAVKNTPKFMMEFYKRCTFFASISQLKELFPSNSLSLPSLTLSLDEPTVQFQNVIRNVQNSAYPVVLLIGKNCIQITSTKKIELINGIQAILNDVIDVCNIEELIKKKETSSETRFILKTNTEEYDLSCPNFQQIQQIINQHKKNIKPLDLVETEFSLDAYLGQLLVLIFTNLLENNTALQNSAYQLYNAFLDKLNLPPNKPQFLSNHVHFISQSFIAVMTKIDPTILNLFVIDACHYIRNQEFYANLNFLKLLKPCILAICQNMDALTLRALVEMTTNHFEFIGIINDVVWIPISTNPVATNHIVDLLLGPVDDVSLEILCALGMNDNQNVIAGKLLANIRKLLIMPQDTAQSVIEFYLQILANFAFHDTLDLDYYLADVLYLVISLAGQGSMQQRISLYYISCNIISNIQNTLDTNLLLYMNEQMLNPFLLSLYGLSYLPRQLNSLDAIGGISNLTDVGHLVHFMADCLIIGSPTLEILHAHRSRLMGLISSSAFQYNKILQPRAFVALGALSSDDADDDLIYQILMVLKYSLTHFEPDDSDLACSTIICLTNIMRGNLYQSDFTRKIIWISIYLLLLGHKKLFIYSLQLLEASLHSLDQNGYFLEKGLIESLLQVKQSFSVVSKHMDKQSGLNFELDFGFALTSALAKGLSDKDTKPMTETVVVSLLNLCDVHVAGNKSELVGLVLFMTCSEQYDVKEIVPELNGINNSIYEVMQCTSDTCILFIMTMTMNFLYLDLPEQTLEMLFMILMDGVQMRPDIFAAISPKLIARLRQLAKNTFNDGFKQNITNLYIKAVEVLGKYNIQLSVLLDETGFQSLTEPLMFDTNKNRQRQLALHVDSLISSIINDEE